MADSSNEHPYGTCEGCGIDLWQNGGRPGDGYCPVCLSNMMAETHAIQQDKEQEARDREDRRKAGMTPYERVQAERRARDAAHEGRRVETDQQRYAVLKVSERRYSVVKKSYALGKEWIFSDAMTGMCNTYLENHLEYEVMKFGPDQLDKFSYKFARVLLYFLLQGEYADECVLDCALATGVLMK